MSPFAGREALQPERTALAWQRTAVTALAILGPLVVVALRMRMPLLAAAGAVGAVACAGVVGAVLRRFHQLGDDERGYSPYPPMVRVAAVTVLAAVGGVAVGLTRWLG